VTFEQVAARWYLHRFARCAVEAYMAACPDDPAVRRLRRALADLRRAAELPFVVGIDGTPRWCRHG